MERAGYNRKEEGRGEKRDLYLSALESEKSVNEILNLLSTIVTYNFGIVGGGFNSSINLLFIKFISSTELSNLLSHNATLPIQ